MHQPGKYIEPWCELTRQVARPRSLLVSTSPFGHINIFFIHWFSSAFQVRLTDTYSSTTSASHTTDTAARHAQCSWRHNRHVQSSFPALRALGLSGGWPASLRLVLLYDCYVQNMAHVAWFCAYCSSTVFEIPPYSENSCFDEVCRWWFVFFGLGNIGSKRITRDPLKWAYILATVKAMPYH